MALAIFLCDFSQKKILPLFKNVSDKNPFWAISQNAVFNQNSGYLNRFLVKLPFLKMYAFIYFTFLLQIVRVAPSLRGYCILTVCTFSQKLQHIGDK